ncbi:MAG: ABC transporter substrate-binding protein [Betaproteobacteria bacterium]|nr:ABC transporter substrate-binding protein [Betaproteobacteria bacterium]MSQ88581.1 ABC transporter substrate-binding protein [Betaproteobacteria bacterium]
MKRIIWSFALAAACAIAPLSAGAQERVIRIGVVMPISGPASYFGVMGREGIDLALEQFKAGVNGYRLQVQYEDSACSPLQATNTVKRLLDQFKPHIVIGEECSDASLAIAPILEQAKVVQLNAGSVTMKLTESGYKYVFRIFPNAEQQSLPLAKVAYEKLKARTAVILHEKTNAGNDNAEGFEKPFVAMGGKVLAKIDFGRDVNDFTAIATRIASLGKVDVLPTFALEGQTVRLSQALAQARIVKGGGGNAVQMGSIWLPYGYDQKAGQASEGYVRIVQFDPTENRKVVQDFIKAFRVKYGADKVPTHINAHAYDAILLIVEAVRRGATDTESIRDRFTKLKDVEVTTGKITFDAKGQNSDLSVVHFVETQKDLSWKGLNWQ